MSIDDEVWGDLRFAACLRRAKGATFATFYDWMSGLPLSPAEQVTYGWIWSGCSAKMEVSACAVARRSGKDERSIRRHFAAIRRAGLWEPIVRYHKGQRVSNHYVLFYHPAMPAELKGPPMRKSGDRTVTRAATASHVACVTVTGDDSSPEAVTESSGQESTANYNSEQAGRGAQAVAVALPKGLMDELVKAFPHDAEDCVRLLFGGDGKEAVRPTAVKIRALRALITRAQRGEVKNAAGLLRSCLLPEADAAADAALRELTAARAEIDDIDARLPSSPSGFALIRQLRVRQRLVSAYIAKYAHVHGPDAPRAEVTMGVSEPLRVAVSDAVRALEEQQKAREDAVAQGRAAEALYRAERALDLSLTGARQVAAE